MRIVGWRTAGACARLIWAGMRTLPALMRYVRCCDAGSHSEREGRNCPKVDTKNALCKCGDCSTTLYCSKECQTPLAWKQGGYKTMCKVKQCERFEGKSQAISKSNAAFFHHLSIRDMRHHLPLLRRLVCSTYPARRSCKLLIRVDYTAVLPAYTVVPLAEMQRCEERRAHPRLPLKRPVDNVYSVVFLPMWAVLYY
ncbi:hypothetical protein DFH08DRAFT_1080310 [Mycena albidolilacea]|uniref:MYND-type domain-containing protein n=1 Tax=Mycena albidolilacea TaxID=1033008 RepID=A0AAD7ESM4_9AGAR|nr:hypothetical protein DFH08DRAFT_1080310 [Mycena albidolilacea]